MEGNSAILITSIVVLIYGHYSRLLSRYNISGPMIFAAIGVLISSLGLDVIKDASPDAQIVQITAEIALIIVLFSDASALNLKKLRQEWTIPTRLLFIGLPLTIVFAAFTATLIFPDEPFIYLLLMSLILAPTDAALGKAVVSDKKVPEKIRSSINVESGLNDGIVFPMLVTVAAVITAGQEGAGDSSWLSFVAQQIIFGAAIGGTIGYLAAFASTKAIEKNFIESGYKNLMPIALAIMAYYLAEYFGGNGFISAFFAGLFLGNYNEHLRKNIEDFAESEGELLILISFVIFGFVFVPATIAFWDFKVFLFAALSLTVLRMIPVAISLIGTKLDLATVLFIGWFGPRGIASVLYVMIVFSELHSIKGHEVIYSVITVTVLFSIILHGLSARPLAKRYGKTHKAKD